jgi:hypothetical protein
MRDDSHRMSRPIDGDDQIVVLAEIHETNSTKFVICGNFSDEDLPDRVRSLDRNHRRWLSCSISTDPPSTSRYTPN